MTAKALVEAMAALVIFLTLAGLGLFQVPSEEPTIEAGLQAQATALLADLPNPPKVTVSGREILVEGRVESHAVRRMIESDLRGIEGAAGVKARLEVLPELAEFRFQILKGEEGTVLKGYVRRAATIDQLSILAGSTAREVFAASGPGPETWDDTVITVAQAIDHLVEAKVEMAGDTVTLTGEALWLRDIAALERQLAELPETWTVSAELAARDDGAPFLLVAEKQRGLGVALRGKLPPALTPEMLSDQFERVDRQTLSVGPVDPGYPSLAPAMLGAVRALAVADEGSAMITPGAVVLSGLRGGDDVDASLVALRAELPEGHLIDVSRRPLTDPEPFWLELARRDGKVRVRGVVPAEVSVDTFGRALGDVDTTDLRQSPYPDISGWMGGLEPVRLVFAEIIEGSILLEESAVTLDARLADPDSAARVDGHLARLPRMLDLRRSVELADDGRTLQARLTYVPTDGARIDGVLPADLSADQVATLLGLPDVMGDKDRDKDMPLPQATEVLTAVGQWLGEAESLDLTISPDSLTITAVLSPGVDQAQIEAAMRKVLGPQDSLDLRVLTNFPPLGTQRQNLALGAAQVFLAGYWLPVLDFDPSVAECARQSRLAERANPVRFLSGSTRLDAQSIRGVNRLSAVVRVCVQNGGLHVKVEGHTDSFGAVGANEVISRERAVVVAVEISKRGVLASGLDVVGYGPARPVADNATAEGRARNRRISLAWDNPAQKVQ